MTDWIDDLLEGKPKGWIIEQVYFKISDLRDGVAGDRAHADMLERYLREHGSPPGAGTDVAEGPCRGCGEPWPCAGIKNAWALLS
ncbi:hypothetical protein ACVGVM_29115 (plasmid) [Pseudonocardia bannensis]|uniref:Uncharacterized protein n=1 Tax=Pseudonocardia bannensis TaxID=630973 RepID=A0A848DLT7_9PSEU|nr:hypothetical protein [Pseudonocardia bannensis]NMH93503.1 hypothetical protein [Pseudonocardia bannensis]